jgi:hypothetical protein
VIVNLDDFWYDDTYFTAVERAAGLVSIFRKVIDLLGGGRAAGEPDPRPIVINPPAVRQQALQVLATRRAYLANVGLGVGAAVNARFTGLDDPTLIATTNAVQGMLAAGNAKPAGAMGPTWCPTFRRTCSAPCWA